MSDPTEVESTNNLRKNSRTESNAGMFTHYGLFWSEKDVNWGRPGKNNQGTLQGIEKTPLGRKGRPSSSEKPKIKLYRDFVGIYCLYGDGKLLYVGEAGLGTGRKLFDRLKEHRTGPLSGRWDKFSWFGREECKGQCEVKAALEQLEATTIAIINPGFNKQSGTFAKAIQVYQVAHDHAEGDLETKLRRLDEKLDLLVQQSKDNSSADSH